VSSRFAQEVATVVAASICWLARWHSTIPGPVGHAVSGRHPDRCSRCDTPPEKLFESIEIFRVIDGPDHVASADFARLPAHEQQALVDAALYPKGRPAPVRPEPPAPAPDPAPADELEDVFA
jgi:hypothetical protein